MQIEIKIDETFKEPKIILITSKMTEDLNTLIRKLADDQPKMIIGVKDEIVEILEPRIIFRIYAQSGKVLAQTDKGEYSLKLRLYEVEQRLDEQMFVRISNSELINLKKVKGFDLGFTGTICVTLLNGKVTYVSRRYVSKIKQVLGL